MIAGCTVSGGKGLGYVLRWGGFHHDNIMVDLLLRRNVTQEVSSFFSSVASSVFSSAVAAGAALAPLKMASFSF